MSTTGNDGNHCWIWWWRHGRSGHSDSTNGRSEKTECDSLFDPGHHLLIGVTSFARNHGCQFLEKMDAAGPMPPVAERTRGVKVPRSISLIL